MRVTSVSICPTEAAMAAGRPALTPELLAASGARYSRNNEGLEAILSRIDYNNLDKSVDGIFKMIDYGHQSIADMVPVAMFIDRLSIFLAYLVWSWCPTAGGQESSTRFIRLNRSGLVDPSLFGLPEHEREQWYAFMNECFDAYSTALNFWEKITNESPELTRIPSSLIEDSSDKVQKQVARMKRNYAFDRARYFLPIAATTNMMLIISARGWVQLCQCLLSHWLPEANLLGTRIREELILSAPRLVKHAERKESFVKGHEVEFRSMVEISTNGNANLMGEAPCESRIEVYKPSEVSESDLVRALEYHDTRYAFTGSAVSRTAVRFSWSAVTIGEIRDLNRHRTGQKYCSLVPQGFYCAKDQLPAGKELPTQCTQVGSHSTLTGLDWLKRGVPAFTTWLLLGTQLTFEHTTTLDKFVYEAELRTGTGAHFRYAKHLREMVAQLRLLYPWLAEAIVLGAGEPE